MVLLGTLGLFKQGLMNGMMWMWPHAMEAMLLASMLGVDVRNRDVGHSL